LLGSDVAVVPATVKLLAEYRVLCEATLSRLRRAGSSG
jgi:hypothetical protein